MKTRVVIGIPVFNESQNIRHLIESIMRDPLIARGDGVVVIYDDCSIDRTPEILVNVQAQHSNNLYVYRSDIRRGKSAGLNWIATFARDIDSQIICFLDGDIIIGENSLDKLVNCVDLSANKHIVSPPVFPLINNTKFPLRDIYILKIRGEYYRKTYRPYVNGRAFALRTRDFPELPSNLAECDDRYLTTVFGRKGISPCFDAVFYYYPPRCVISFVKDRAKTQFRLIRLSKIQRQRYFMLRNRRFSFFHSYLLSYPPKERALFLKSLSCRDLLAIVIEKLLTTLGKIIGEINGIALNRNI